MSAKDIVGRGFWTEVAKDLRGDALDWWTKHRDDLVETTLDEAKAVFKHLDRGDAAEAKYAMALRMMRDDRDAWEEYRNGTTAELTGIARRRATMMDAFAQLGQKAAEKVGKAAMGALGL